MYETLCRIGATEKVQPVFMGGQKNNFMKNGLGAVGEMLYSVLLISPASEASRSQKWHESWEKIFQSFCCGRGVPPVHLQRKSLGFGGLGGEGPPGNFSAAGENFENYVIKNTFSL